MEMGTAIKQVLKSRAVKKALAPESVMVKRECKTIQGVDNLSLKAEKEKEKNEHANCCVEFVSIDVIKRIENV